MHISRGSGVRENPGRRFSSRRVTRMLRAGILNFGLFFSSTISPLGALPYTLHLLTYTLN